MIHLQLDARVPIYILAPVSIHTFRVCVQYLFSVYQAGSRTLVVLAYRGHARSCDFGVCLTFPPAVPAIGVTLRRVQPSIPLVDR